MPETERLAIHGAITAAVVKGLNQAEILEHFLTARNEIKLMRVPPRRSKEALSASWAWH